MRRLTDTVLNILLDTAKDTAISADLSNQK